MPNFLNDYARLAALFARERRGEPGWSIYLKHLRGALGWPALVMTFAGLLIAVTRIVRDSNRVRWVLLVTFATVYFLVMAGSYQIYGRYLLPLFPMAAILWAVATAAAVRLLLRAPLPNRATHLLALALVGGLIGTGPLVDWVQSQPGPREHGRSGVPVDRGACATGIEDRPGATGSDPSGTAVRVGQREVTPGRIL